MAKMQRFDGPEKAVRVGCLAVALLGAFACGGTRESTEQAAAAEPFAPPPVEVPRLAVRRNRTCAVDDDARVRCWGGNPIGQAGPALEASFGEIRQLALGRDQYCVLDAAGAVRCVGTESWMDDVPSEGLPTGVRLLAHVEDHACAVKESADLVCWGSGSALGRQGRLSPFRVEGLPPVRTVAVSRSHTCALGQDGSVWCWGDAFFKALGIAFEGEAPRNVADPQRVAGIERATLVDVGHETSCIVADDELKCWGRSGVVGGSYDEPAITPVSLGRFAGATALAVTDGRICVVAEGRVKCGSRAGFEPVPGLTEVVEVAIGAAHACARRRDGSVHCWGARDEGQLGEPAPNPALPSVEPALSNIVRFIDGDATFYAVREDGSVLRPEGRPSRFAEVAELRGMEGVTSIPRGRCWWSEGLAHCVHTAFGRGGGWDSSPPTPHPELGAVVEMASWRSGACVRTRTGPPQCFELAPLQGRGVDSPPGTPVTAAWEGGDAAVPPFTTAVVRSLRSATRLAGKEDALIARLRNGTVLYGVEDLRPVRGLRGASDFMAESNYACALVRGRAACWAAEHGDRPELRFVRGIDDATKLAVGTFHGCALVAEGRARCWGEGGEGQLGDGALHDFDVDEEEDGPLESFWVGGAESPLAGLVDVVASNATTCVLDGSGEVRCFGAVDFLPPPDRASTPIVALGPGGRPPG